MREHVGKALKRRDVGLQKAVDEYNVAALECSPPRPTVDWEKVSHYQFLEDFPLLRECREDIRSRPWARPAVQFTLKQHLRIKRAREEIVRLNVEIRRVVTHIADEDRLLDKTLQTLVENNDVLAAAFADFAVRRKRINAQVRVRLVETSELKSFSGTVKEGWRKGVPREDVAMAVNTSVERVEDINEQEEVLLDDRAPSPDLDEDDEAGEQAISMVDYVADLSSVRR